MKKIGKALILFLLTSPVLMSQDWSKMMAFDFDGALSEYADSISAVKSRSPLDSARLLSFEAAARNAENALSMNGFCAHPAVIARAKFSIDEFVLRYPLPDKAWRKTDNPDRPFIYHPRPVGDTIRLSVKDSLELYPMICGGKRYFASNTLPGMGGYDIFVQHRDPVRGIWSEPENLGFPYSSPADDFLFVDTADGRYSIFASNRFCPSDSVWVYVLDYEATPVRSAETKPEALLKLAELSPNGGEFAGEDANASLYMEKIAAKKQAGNALASAEEELSALRGEYIFAEGDRRESMRKAIVEKESAITGKRNAYVRASRELEDLEMKFEREGVQVDMSGLIGEESRQAFEFAERSFGLEVNVKYSKQ